MIGNWPSHEKVIEARKNAQKAFMRKKICSCKYCGRMFNKVGRLGAHVFKEHRKENDIRGIRPTF